MREAPGCIAGRPVRDAVPLGTSNLDWETHVAQKVQVILVDDIDGGAAVETVGFSLDGVSYKIDLSVKNAAKLRDAFAGYVGAARKVGGRAGRRSASARRSGGVNRSAEIRAWAKSNKVKVSERGRISAAVVAKYEAAKK